MFEAFTYFCGALFILTATLIKTLDRHGHFRDRVDEDQDAE